MMDVAAKGGADGGCVGSTGAASMLRCRGAVGFGARRLAVILSCPGIAALALRSAAKRCSSAALREFSSHSALEVRRCSSSSLSTHLSKYSVLPALPSLTTAVGSAPD